nr:CRISPR-associated endonuclease Cas2 [Chthoniobacterales bacterium]
MRTTYLVCYDISNDKRLRKVFKTCRNYGDHLQYSVFECDLNGSEIVKLEHELNEIINS